MKRYGYHRTSTKEQHLDRGITEITAYCEQNQLELEGVNEKDRCETTNEVLDCISDVYEKYLGSRKMMGIL